MSVKTCPSHANVIYQHVPSHDQWCLNTEQRVYRYITVLIY